MGNKTKQLFIDMETLGVSYDSKVISIGILCDDIVEPGKYIHDHELYQNGLYLLLDIDSQEKRTVDKRTLDYWKSVLPTIDKRTFSGKKISLDEAYLTIENYVKSKRINWKYDTVWSRGLFDKFLWQSLYPDSNLFPFFVWRDSVTFLDMLCCGDINGGISKKEMKVKHNALYNCIYEYRKIQNAFDMH